MVAPPPHARCNFRWKFFTAPLNYSRDKEWPPLLKIIIAHPLGKLWMLPYICLGEGQEVQSVTFHQLRENVTVLASALKNLGIKKGDRVVGMNIVFNRKPHLKLIWSWNLNLFDFMQASVMEYPVIDFHPSSLPNFILSKEHSVFLWKSNAHCVWCQ